MKKIETSFVIAAAFALATLTLQAIPNTVGGFVNPAGMRFENFVGLANTWKPNAKLPGKWENWKDPKIQDSRVMLYRLGLSADVFGIRATQVTVQIKDDQILQFNVVFDKSSVKSASLVDQLKTNIKSFTGDSGGKDKKTFAHNKINIQLKDGEDGSVIVSFSPKAAAVAVR
jgi:hypothetical protein